MERIIVLFVMMVSLAAQALVPLFVLIIEIFIKVAFALLGFIFQLIKEYPKVFAIIGVAIVALFALSLFFAQKDTYVQRTKVVVTGPNEQSYATVRSIIDGIYQQTAEPKTIVVPQKTSTMQIRETTGIVTSVELNVRSTPDPDANNIISVLKRNTRVYLTDNFVRVGDSVWVEIKIATGYGWINAKYIRYQ